jgi:hypothetical protein
METLPMHSRILCTTCDPENTRSDAGGKRILSSESSFTPDQFKAVARRKRI